MRTSAYLLALTLCLAPRVHAQDLVLSVVDGRPGATPTTAIVAQPGETVDVKVIANTTRHINSFQFTLDYNASIATLTNVQLGDVGAGFSVTKVNEALPYEPSSPNTTENVLVQIVHGSSTGYFTGQQVVAVLTFVMDAGYCGETPSPLTFDRDCFRTQFLAIDDPFGTICPEIVGGGLWTNCATDAAVMAPTIQLHQNTPNPFNPSTTIRFETPISGPVGLRVFSATGRLVKVLVDATLPSGPHAVEWQGDDDNGTPLPSGLYFYQLSANGDLKTRPTTLLK